MTIFYLLVTVALNALITAIAIMRLKEDIPGLVRREVMRLVLVNKETKDDGN